jgi:hypothetical protein
MAAGRLSHHGAASWTDGGVHRDSEEPMKVNFKVLNTVCFVILVTIALPLFIVKSLQMHERFQRIEDRLQMNR